ncbi:hypothetical protein ACLB2K_057566 [Fragaria x ananassa]
MISARELGVIWGNTPIYWRWISHPESRFAEVAELLHVCWLEIHGELETRLLSPSTLYKGYLVFKFTARASGFVHLPAEVSMGLEGGEISSRIEFLHSGVRKHDDDGYPKVRSDGWLEIEMDLAIVVFYMDFAVNVLENLTKISLSKFSAMRPPTLSSLKSLLTCIQNDHETEKTIDPLNKDLEENLFISDLFEESAEDSYSYEDSDEDTDEDVYDLPNVDDMFYDYYSVEEETDDEEETPRKEPSVCQCCGEGGEEDPHPGENWVGLAIRDPASVRY